MIVLKNGKVLVFATPVFITRCILFEPPHCVSGANDTLPCDTVLDCPGGVCMDDVIPFDGPDAPNLHLLLSSGHAALADGKILFTGGTPAVATTTLYDPDVDPPGPAATATAAHMHTEPTDTNARIDRNMDIANDPPETPPEATT